MIESIVEQEGEMVNEYPRIMTTDDALIVLFDRAGYGIVLSCPSGYWPIGHYDNDWAMQEFSPYIGKVTLISK